jgi:hypothetical protein
VVIASLALVAVLMLFFTAYSSAFGDPNPRGIPIAAAAPATVDRDLAASSALRVRVVATPAHVEQLIRTREVYGGLIVSGGDSLELEIASGAGHSVALALTSVANATAQRLGTRLSIVDLAPLSTGDPTGAVEFYFIVFLTIGGSLGAMLLGQVLGGVRSFPHAGRHLATFVLYSGVLAAAFAALGDAGFGALLGHPGSVFFVSWCYALAVCLAIAGVASLLGRPVALLVIVGLVGLGNTSSGGPIGRPMLDPFFSSLTPILPQGAGLTLLRGALYFHGRGDGEGLLSLAVWAAAGLVLLAGAGLLHGRRADGFAPVAATS